MNKQLKRRKINYLFTLWQTDWECLHTCYVAKVSLFENYIEIEFIR